jgi:cytosine deaminase
MTQTDIFLQEAILEAKMGLQEGGIPIGSVIVHTDKIIDGHNKRIQKEASFFMQKWMPEKNAGRQRSSIYRSCTLYTTPSPCPMYSAYCCMEFPK